MVTFRGPEVVNCWLSKIRKTRHCLVREVQNFVVFTARYDLVTNLVLPWCAWRYTTWAKRSAFAEQTAHTHGGRCWWTWGIGKGWPCSALPRTVTTKATGFTRPQASKSRSWWMACVISMLVTCTVKDGNVNFCRWFCNTVNFVYPV